MEEPNAQDYTTFNISKDDEKLLRHCIGIRLSPSALKSTKLNTNTQKVEAVNRMYSKVNPKSITFSRNFPARIHSGIHSINNGLADSIVLKSEAIGSPIVPGSRCALSLKASQNREDYYRNIMKSKKRKSKRAYLRMKRYSVYDTKASDDQVHYEKDCNLNNIMKNNNIDHNYTK